MTEDDWQRLRCRLANGPRCSEREADEWVAKPRAAVDVRGMNRQEAETLAIGIWIATGVVGFIAGFAVALVM